MRREQVEALLNFYKKIDEEISFICTLQRRTQSYYETDALPAEIWSEIRRQEEKKQNLLEIKKAILEGLDKLETTEKLIIFNFYVLDKGWPYITYIVHYSDRYCMTIRARAIDKLKEIYGANKLLKDTVSLPG